MTRNFTTATRNPFFFEKKKKLQFTYFFAASNVDLFCYTYALEASKRSSDYIPGLKALQ